jgi:hypothetical protein
MDENGIITKHLLCQHMQTGPAAQPISYLVYIRGSFSSRKKLEHEADHSLASHDDIQGLAGSELHYTNSWWVVTLYYKGSINY